MARLIAASVVLVLWAALPASALASDVFYVGDGLGASTTPFVKKALLGFTVRGDNGGGRTSGDGVAALAAGIQRDDQAVVFDFGSSDDPGKPGTLASNLSRAAKLAGKRCIVVATIYETAGGGAAPTGLNRAVSSFRSGHSRSQLADWRATAAAHPGYMSADGSQLTPSGAKARGALFADAAQRCLNDYAGSAPAPGTDAPSDAGSSPAPADDSSLGSGTPADSDLGPPPPASRTGRGARSRSRPEPQLTIDASNTPLGRLGRMVAATTPGSWLVAGISTLRAGLSGAQSAAGGEAVLGAG
jgi:hypothetical protein